MKFIMHTIGASLVLIVVLQFPELSTVKKFHKCCGASFTRTILCIKYQLLEVCEL